MIINRYCIVAYQSYFELIVSVQLVESYQIYNFGTKKEFKVHLNNLALSESKLEQYFSIGNYGIFL